jgi:hypothetical protein
MNIGATTSFSGEVSRHRQPGLKGREEMNLSKRFSSILLLIAITCGTLLAGAESEAAFIVNFSSLSQPGTSASTYGSSISYQGFNFAVTGGDGDTLATWQSGSANLPVGGAASTSLLSYSAFAQVSMEQSTGSAFSLASIDIAPWGANQDQSTPTFDVSFTGIKAGGGTVSQTFTVTNSTQPLLQTFAFNGFSNLAELDVVQGVYVSGTAFQFDNIAGSVPEPASLGLLCLGAFGLFLRRRAA